MQTRMRHIHLLAKNSLKMFADYKVWTEDETVWIELLGGTYRIQYHGIYICEAKCIECIHPDGFLPVAQEPLAYALLEELISKAVCDTVQMEDVTILSFCPEFEQEIPKEYYCDDDDEDDDDDDLIN